MKNHVLAFLCAAFSLSVSAQSADSSRIFLAKALEERTNGRFAPAFTYLQTAIKYDSSNLDALRYLGLTAVELRRYDNAKLAFQKLYASKPDDTAAIRNLANLNLYTHKWEDAIRFAQLMLRKKMGGDINFIIGKSYYELENYGEGLEYLNAAFAENPKDARIPYMIARAYVDMSNYRFAARYYQKALAIDTTNARWFYEMAMVYAAIPDDKTAVSYYELAAEKGYKIDNDYLENLSVSCVLSGQPEKGIELMLKVLEKKPADLELLYNLAEAYYKTGKYQQAINYWDKILYYDKQNAKALYMIGMAYQKKGESSKGQLLCDKAIEMDPSLANLKQKKMDMGL